MKNVKLIAVLCGCVGFVSLASAQGHVRTYHGGQRGVMTYRGGHTGPERVLRHQQPTTRVLRFAEVAPIPEYARNRAARYGAHADPDQTILVSGEGYFRFRISPWARVHPLHGKDIERQRLRWLKVHGYVGGVRTYTNRPAEKVVSVNTNPISDGVVVDESAEILPVQGATPTAKPVIQPRATFRIPEGAVRATPTFRVDGSKIPSEISSGVVVTVLCDDE